MQTLKKYSLDEMLNKHIGTHGTPERDTFETELQKDVLASIIKNAFFMCLIKKTLMFHKCFTLAFFKTHVNN